MGREVILLLVLGLAQIILCNEKNLEQERGKSIKPPGKYTIPQRKYPSKYAKDEGERIESPFRESSSAIQHQTSQNVDFSQGNFERSGKSFETLKEKKESIGGSGQSSSGERQYQMNERGGRLYKDEDEESNLKWGGSFSSCVQREHRRIGTSRITYDKSKQNTEEGYRRLNSRYSKIRQSARLEQNEPGDIPKRNTEGGSFGSQRGTGDIGQASRPGQHSEALDYPQGYNAGESFGSRYARNRKTGGAGQDRNS